MSQDLIKAIDEALKETENWSVKGWKQTFGHRNVPVNNLAEAEALDKTFVNKLEAVNFWRRVKDASKECIVEGNKAKAFLQAGDMRNADDIVYYCVQIEKYMRGEKAHTWGKVYDLIKQNKAA